MTADTANAALPVLLTEAQVAEIIGLPAATIKAHRARGVGLPYVKFGKRVRYRADDIAAYIAANTITPGPSSPQQD
jgi:hypothetical protein